MCVVGLQEFDIEVISRLRVGVPIETGKPQISGCGVSNNVFASHQATRSRYNLN